MARFAILIWPIPHGDIEVGEVVEVDDQEQTRRANVRAVRTNERARVFLENLAWLPAGMAADDRIIPEIVRELRQALASCAFSLEAHDAATAVMVRWENQA